jgi:hypothetical protein
MHLLLSVRLSLVPESRLKNAMLLAEEIGKMLWSLIRSLQDERNGRTSDEKP